MHKIILLRVALGAAVITACGGGDKAKSDSAGATRTLALGAYTTPREVYGQKILPSFAAAWKQQTGESLRFEESYLGSGAQARAIVAGFRADVAALALEPDITTLVNAKLVDPTWSNAATGGIASRSLVVLAVRSGNPKNVRDWDDLRRPGIAVLTPNPATSGGAMWNIAAIWGAAFRGATTAAAHDSAAAQRFLADVLRNVTIMDKGARESILNFEQGVGDVAITYENEVIAARKAGKPMDYVIPRSTIWIETPVAVVRGYAEPKGNTAAAEGLVQFLSTPEAQRAFSEHGFRPATDAAPAELTAGFPAVSNTFTIRDLGGWPAVAQALFAPGGVFPRAQSAPNGR